MTLSAHSRAGGDSDLGPGSAGRSSVRAPHLWIPACAGMSGLVWASAALAHPGHATTLAEGLSHPFGGTDHLLAMLAVGLWASLRGGRALWAWPTSFVAAMLAGFALARGVAPFAVIEPAILASVIVLGALTAANARVPTTAGVALVAAFGLAHGFAHGTEGSGAGFVAGFTLSTVLLHGLGLGAGLSLRRHPALVRLLGAGATLGGLALAIAS